MNKQDTISIVLVVILGFLVILWCAFDIVQKMGVIK
jgi:hypothetical protein